MHQDWYRSAHICLIDAAVALATPRPNGESSCGVSATHSRREIGRKVIADEVFLLDGPDGYQLDARDLHVLGRYPRLGYFALRVRSGSPWDRGASM
jgi:hypothetical protein